MITVSDLGLQYSGQPLFSHVDLPAPLAPMMP